MTKASDIRARMSRTAVREAQPPSNSAPAPRPTDTPPPEPAGVSSLDTRYGAAPARKPKPVRLTLDLEPDRYQRLRMFTTTNYTNAAVVLRALLRELDQDPDLNARIRAAIHEGRS